MAVRTLQSIDILSDKPLQLQVNAVALGFMGVGVAGAVLALATGLASLGDASLGWALGLCLGYFACLPVHELVHAAFFKLFAPECKVRFGFQSGFLYAGAPGTVYPRKQMIVVLLAPAVLVTSAAAAIPASLGYPVLAWLLATTHLGGCAGDLLMVWRALRAPGCTHVRDTEVGIDLLAKD